MIKELCRKQLVKEWKFYVDHVFWKPTRLFFTVLVSLQQQHWIFAHRQPMFVLPLCWMSWKSPKSFLLCFFWLCFQLTFISNRKNSTKENVGPFHHFFWNNTIVFHCKNIFTFYYLIISNCILSLAEFRMSSFWFISRS